MGMWDDFEMPASEGRRLPVYLLLDTSYSMNGAPIESLRKGKLKELVIASDTADSQSTYTINRPDFDKYLKVESQSLSAKDFKSFFVIRGLVGAGFTNDI